MKQFFLWLLDWGLVIALVITIIIFLFALAVGGIGNEKYEEQSEPQPIYRTYEQSPSRN